jgi:hypothetical protein
MKEHIKRLKKIIDSIDNLLHADSCIIMINQFHARYGQKAHDEAHQLYGYLEATLKHKQRNS